MNISDKVKNKTIFELLQDPEINFRCCLTKIEEPDFMAEMFDENNTICYGKSYFFIFEDGSVKHGVCTKEEFEKVREIEYYQKYYYYRSEYKYRKEPKFPEWFKEYGLHYENIDYWIETLSRNPEKVNDFLITDFIKNSGATIEVDNLGNCKVLKELGIGEPLEFIYNFNGVQKVSYCHSEEDRELLGNALSRLFLEKNIFPSLPREYF